MINLDMAKQEALKQLALEEAKQAALQQLDSSEDNSEEYTFGQRTLQPIHGFAGTTGELGDLYSSVVANVLESPLTEGLESGITNVSRMPLRPPKEREAEIQLMREPKIQKALTAPIESLVGRRLTPSPNDTTGKVLHEFGSFMVPLPGAGLGRAAKAGIKPLLKTLGKETPIALGASTALNATPEFSEKGSLPRIGEDLVKVLVGSAAGRKLSGTANYIKGLSEQGRFKSALENASKMPMDFLAKTASKIGHPDLRTFELAEKHGVEVPFNVGMNSRVRNFVANTGLKSMFVSDAYKKSLKDADESMVNAVKKSIDTLGTPDFKPSEASQSFKNYLKEDEKIFQTQSRQLYDLANKSIKPDDVVYPKNTIARIHGILDVLNRDISSPSTKRLTKLLNELSSNWGISNAPLRAEVGGVDISSRPAVQELMKTFKSRVEVSPNRLYKAKQEIGEILGYDKDVKGKEGLLYGLEKALDKDMASSPNKEYVKLLGEARKHFYDNIASRFRTDMARSIMTGEVPEEAFNLMSNPENIKLLEKISGESPKGKDLFDSLKKAKVRQIMERAMEGDLETGSIRSAPFSKIFSKGEKNQEVLEELLGKKEYNNLSEIAEIAEAFSKSNKELLNTSGTALTTADLNRIEKATLGTLGLVFGAYKMADVTGALAAIGAPYALSRLVANKNFVNLSRQYAISRAQGKDKYSRTLLNKLIPLTEREIKYMTIHEASEGSKE